MNRLLLVGAIAGLGIVGCSKGPDSAGARAGADSVGQGATTDSSRGAAAPPPAPMSMGGRVSIPHDSTIELAAADTAVSGSDVTGAYMIIGTVPTEFAEIDHLGLATIDAQGNPAPLNGFIRPKMSSAKDYKLIAPKMTGRSLTFTTRAVGGISYSFTGAFTKLGNFPVNPPEGDAPVLKGTLSKLRDGRIVAMTSAEFSYSAGG